MKKVIIYILWFLVTIAMIIEFTYSIIYTITEAIGIKINEGVTALESIYQKAKS